MLTNDASCGGLEAYRRGKLSALKVKAIYLPFISFFLGQHAKLRSPVNGIFSYCMKAYL